MTFKLLILPNCLFIWVLSLPLLFPSLTSNNICICPNWFWQDNHRAIPPNGNKCTFSQSALQKQWFSAVDTLLGLPWTQAPRLPFNLLGYWLPCTSWPFQSWWRRKTVGQPNHSSNPAMCQEIHSVFLSLVFSYLGYKSGSLWFFKTAYGRGEAIDHCRNQRQS